MKVRGDTAFDFIKGVIMDRIVDIPVDGFVLPFKDTILREGSATFEDLLDYHIEEDLVVLNMGAQPTFDTSNRSEVLDITFCNELLRR